MRLYIYDLSKNLLDSLNIWTYSKIHWCTLRFFLIWKRLSTNILITPRRLTCDVILLQHCRESSSPFTLLIYRMQTIVFLWWHTSAITCQIDMLTCQISMLSCRIFMLTCHLFICWKINLKNVFLPN